MWRWLHNNIESSEANNAQKPRKSRFPKIWVSGGTVQKLQSKRHWLEDIEGKYDFSRFDYLGEDVLNYDIANFPIYVNGQDFYLSHFPVFKIPNNKKIAYVWLDEEMYYKMIFATYCATYCCGVSIQHLTSGVYPVITSIMRYHVYFTIRRILRRRGEYGRYIQRV